MRKRPTGTGDTTDYKHTDADADKIPAEYTPLGMWQYFGYSILFSVPLIGLVFLIIYAVSNKNINRRNFARGFLLLGALGFLFITFCTALAAKMQP